MQEAIKPDKKLQNVATFQERATRHFMDLKSDVKGLKSDVKDLKQDTQEIKDRLDGIEQILKEIRRESGLKV